MNCGNPLYSDAVTAGGGGASGARALAELWSWALAARWPLGAAGAALLALALLAAVPLWLRRRRSAPPPPPFADGKLPPRASKLSNLEAVRRERPASCAEPPPLNNVDTLRSYGSAGDELEGIPPDYRRNLNIDADRKPWSEQMHLHTFVDNKIYNGEYRPPECSLSTCHTPPLDAPLFCRPEGDAWRAPRAPRAAPRRCGRAAPGGRVPLGLLGLVRRRRAARHQRGGGLGATRLVVGPPVTPAAPHAAARLGLGAG